MKEKKELKHKFPTNFSANKGASLKWRLLVHTFRGRTYF